jgi:hypothetical protein
MPETTNPSIGYNPNAETDWNNEIIDFNVSK